MDNQQNIPQKGQGGGKKPYHGKRRHPFKKGRDRRPENTDAQRVNDAMAEEEMDTGAQQHKKKQHHPQNNQKKPHGNNQPSATVQNQATEISPKNHPTQPSRPSRGTSAPRAPQSLPAMDNLLIDDCPEEVERLIIDEINADEIEKILSHDIFANPQTENIPNTIPKGKVVVAGIRFRTGGKTYFFAPGRIQCTKGDFAIVETARGLEFGEVSINNCLVDESMIVPPLRPVIRLATPEDIEQNRQNHAKEEEATRIGKEKIAAHKLDMKLVSVQYTFDCSKLLFYFTSEGRVDFRELVKDLASVFRIRIELRQIGIRDEARMLGGLGVCGRPLCCSTFLSDFGQVSMKMAKDQGLALNSTKISGCCGRLMCCLRYEYETYLSLSRELPAPGSFVNTPDGMGVVTEIFPLEGQVKVSLRGDNAPAPKKYKKSDIAVQMRHTPTETSPIEESTEPDSETEM